MLNGNLILNYACHYLPKLVVNNHHFKQTGLSCAEIETKTGIKERRWSSRSENTNTMAIEAVKKAIPYLPFPINEVDLIIGATYTPYDTIFSLSHSVQNYFHIPNAKCVTINAACSSFINAMEITECFFIANKAQKALIVCSENNSVYSNISSKDSAFIWGDGAAAAFVSNNKFSENELHIMDISSKGLGNQENADNSVVLKPNDGGLQMPKGKDVFQNACKFMISETTSLLERNHLPITDLSYFIPHQANKRIIDFVKKELNLADNQVITNIEKYGNTGSASTLIALSQNWEFFKPKDTIAITVFGGGYSCGSMLLKKH